MNHELPSYEVAEEVVAKEEEIEDKKKAIWWWIKKKKQKDLSWKHTKTKKIKRALRAGRRRRSSGLRRRG